MSPTRPDSTARPGRRSKRRIPGWLCLGLIVWAPPRFAQAAVSIGLNFTGNAYGVDSPDQPPDSNGAVGPSHFVEFVNGRFSVYDKTTGGVLSFGTPLLLKAGAATFQNPDATGASRWGDYSATTVDPADATRFWTIQAYPSSGTAWSTQITESITREPALSITLSGTSLVISWPASVGYQLQSTSSLGPTPSWQPVTQTPTLQGGIASVQVYISSGQEYFRLRRVP